MENKNAIARYNPKEKQWDISEGDTISSFEFCIISNCTVEIPEDAQGIEDVIFYGTHFSNPKEVELVSPTYLRFNTKSKMFEDVNGNQQVFNGEGHMRLSTTPTIFMYSQKLSMQH
jgi:hypothetical protein